MKSFLNPKISSFLCLVLTLLFAEWVHSQEVYPNRPVTFIVAFSPGGSTDLAFRLLIKETENFSCIFSLINIKTKQVGYFILS